VPGWNCTGHWAEGGNSGLNLLFTMLIFRKSTLPVALPGNWLGGQKQQNNYTHESFITNTGIIPRRFKYPTDHRNHRYRYFTFKYVVEQSFWHHAQVDHEEEHKPDRKQCMGNRIEIVQMLPAIGAPKNNVNQYTSVY
jgi:hypothetical protein